MLEPVLVGKDLSQSSHSNARFVTGIALWLRLPSSVSSPKKAQWTEVEIELLVQLEGELSEARFINKAIAERIPSKTNKQISDKRKFTFDNMGQKFCAHFYTFQFTVTKSPYWTYPPVGYLVRVQNLYSRRRKQLATEILDCKLVSTKCDIKSSNRAGNLWRKIWWGVTGG
jgi:hypothetical protein